MFIAPNVPLCDYLFFLSVTFPISGLCSQSGQMPCSLCSLATGRFSSASFRLCLVHVQHPPCQATLPCPGKECCILLIMSPTGISMHST